MIIAPPVNCSHTARAKHCQWNPPIKVEISPDIAPPDTNKAGNSMSMKMIAAPAQNFPAPGGASFSELRNIFQYLAGTGRVCAVSMSTWNPKLDKDGKSQQVCMELLNFLL